MDKPGTIFDRDKIAQHNVMGWLFQWQEGKERLVTFSFQLLALHPFHHRHFFFPKDLFQQGFCQDQFFHSALRKCVFHFDIIHIRPGRDCHIGRQRPGGSGPHQERSILFIYQRHTDKDRWVFGVFAVPKRDLMV